MKKPRSGVIPVTPDTIKEALPLSGGVLATIAKRLGCSYQVLCDRTRTKQGPDWDEVRRLIELEKERMVDTAETTISEMMEQRLDFSVARASAQYILSGTKRGRARGYGDRREVTLEGGRRPIRVENVVPLEDLDLPLSVRKAVLKALEEKRGAVENEVGDNGEDEEP